MGALERGLYEENVYQILQEAEQLSCPCDEMKRMCHEYMKSNNLERSRKRKPVRIAGHE
jgi:hypothetical protein